MSQLNYELEQPKADLGMLFDAYPNATESRAAEAAVNIGAGVVEGTLPGEQCLMPTAAGVFAGIALKTHRLSQDLAGNVQYPVNDTVNVLRQGRVYVLVNENVNVGDAAELLIDGTGRFVVTAGAGTMSVPGVFKTAANLGEIAALEINMP